MAQNYGLGRGLASLIPQKRKSASEADSPRFDETSHRVEAGNKTGKITEPKKDYNYFGASPAAGSVSSELSAVKPISIKPTPSKAPNDDTAGGKSSVIEADISLIVSNPHQPRIRFDESKLKELADSIKAHGIIQPLVVTKNNNGYEIIAGERRYEAAKIAGLKKVPVIIRDATEQQKLEIAIIENVQRHDLNPVEEAKAFKKLTEEFDMDQVEIAEKLGKSRSSVANKMRLLNLPFDIQIGIISEKITEGHAKAILAITDPERQRALYDLILKSNLTVRQVENKVKEVTVKTHKRNVTVDPAIKQIEDDLSGTLGTKVRLTKSGGGGKIIIEYYSQEELDNILSKIK